MVERIVIMIFLIVNSGCDYWRFHREDIARFEEYYQGSNIKDSLKDERIERFYKKYPHAFNMCRSQIDQIKQVGDFDELLHEELASYCFRDLIYTHKSHHLVIFAKIYIQHGVDLVQQDQFGSSPIVTLVFLKKFDVYEYIKKQDKKLLAGDPERQEFYRMLKMYAAMIKNI